MRTLVDRLHLILALLAAGLIVTSPWVAMLRGIPDRPGILDWTHIAGGLAAAALVVPYLLGCLRHGRWRLYFPWAGGRFEPIASDLKGLLHGRVPSAEGGGLFAALEGLTLLALVGAAATGVAWLLTAGSTEALDWRAHHVLAARTLIVLLVVHAISVSLHVLEFAGD
jgi:hypothetical protein